MSHTYTLRQFADMLKNVRERYNFPRLEIELGSDQARDLETAIRETLEVNTKLREAVEALSKELTTEAQSMMRQPEAGVIRSIAERLHNTIWRNKP